MLIQFSSIGRAEPNDLAAILPALAEAADAPDLDHARLAAVLDWVQYRQNFRAPVMVRPFAREPETPDHDGPLAEIAIDVRRAGTIAQRSSSPRSSSASARRWASSPTSTSASTSRSWVRPSKSVMWSFNRSYWRHLAAWDETFQKDYAAALPGGVSDGTNPEFWDEQIVPFMATLNRLDEWSELPDEIHVLELGVGDGQQAKVWLDSFAAACKEQGRDYLVAPALPDGRLLAPRAAARARARRGLRRAGRGHRARLPQPDHGPVATCTARSCSPTPATSTTTSPPTS